MKQIVNIKSLDCYYIRSLHFLFFAAYNAEFSQIEIAITF